MWEIDREKVIETYLNFYPAFWSYEVKKPFTLAQVDTKDIYTYQSFSKWQVHGYISAFPPIILDKVLY